MNFISKYLGMISMYRSMFLFLAALLATAAVFSLTGQLFYSALDIVLQAIFFVAACWAFNFLIAKFLKVKINFESAVITGLILSLIVGPLSMPGQWLVLVFISFAAIVSKYIFVVNKMHIFNPAAFGVVASAFVIAYPASWWVGVGALSSLIIILGLLMAFKMRFLNLIGAFFAAYGSLYALYFMLAQKIPVIESVQQGLSFIYSAPLLFFAFVMLIEPLTAPETKKKRLYYGLFIGASLFAFQVFVPQVPYSLEISLLAGNLFALTLKRNMRQVFTLVKREKISPDIESFWFKPRRPLKFVPGQYLEYTLEHKRPDGRGMRRFFTMASSPTEEEVLLTTRFSEKGSTFKKKLKAFKEEDKITAAKISGDFTPPSDVSEKLVFIAGGIGITPFRSMVKYFIDDGQERDIVLLYAASKKEDFAFKEIFEDAEKRFGMKSVYIEGQVKKEAIEKEIPDAGERTFYISGPEPMVRAVEKQLRKMGVSKKRVKHDYFPGYE